jgi:Asp-tRNA(Asn)/Glu-tRNA(Gln) amidotransferase A subunit family amidase
MIMTGPVNKQSFFSKKHSPGTTFRNHHMSQELCYLSANEALKLFRTKELSPVELMGALIQRSESKEPEINAFSHTYFEQAMEQARASEIRYGKGEPQGLLDGIAVAIKDEVDVKGQANTEGSLIYQNRVSDEDAVLVARLRREGAIFHARTTCPEFCSLWNTTSRLFGVTRNPWNLEMTPGGSSGGSGASLAAGTSMLASGSDIGGSIRFPASMSGLVGYKPPYGRIPETYAPFNQETYCANGPMARTVADAALMQNIMSGYHFQDSASALTDIDIPLSFPADLNGMRLAFSMDFAYLDVEPDIVKNTLETVELLRALGAEVVEVDALWPKNIEWAYNAHMDQLFGSSVSGEMEQHRELMCDYNIMLAEDSLKRRSDAGDYYKSAMIESDMYKVFGALMEEFDAFICPTTCSTNMKADFDPSVDDYMVNGKVLDYDLLFSTCHIFNMMGRCPAISVPSGLSDNGVPTGLHIASKAFDDIAVFRVAAALESSQKIISSMQLSGS